MTVHTVGRPPKHLAVAGDPISSFDAIHRVQMEQGSIALRDRIFRLLADRQAKFSAKVDLHDAARKDIRRGLHRDVVMRNYDLSITAYDQLAGQVRAGA